MNDKKRSQNIHKKYPKKTKYHIMLRKHVE